MLFRVQVGLGVRRRKVHVALSHGHVQHVTIFGAWRFYGVYFGLHVFTVKRPGTYLPRSIAQMPGSKQTEEVFTQITANIPN